MPLGVQHASLNIWLVKCVLCIFLTSWLSSNKILNISEWVFKLLIMPTYAS